MTDRHIVTVDTEYVAPGLAAAYLRVEGDEVAVVETSTAHAVPRLLAALAAAGRRPEQVRWVIVTHAHLDHAGGASALLQVLPRATLLAHPRAARHLIDPSRLVASASQVYGEENFRALYGAIDPIPAARVQTVDDGQSVPLGASTLQFFHTRGHANHHAIVVDPALATVFTGDTFGLVYPRLQRARRLAFPSTSPTDFDAPAAHASVDQVLGLGVQSAHLTHFGEIRDLDVVAAQLHRWLDLSAQLLAEAQHRGGTPADAEAFLRPRLDEAMEVAAHDAGLVLDDDDRKLLAFDVALNAQGLAFAATRPPRAA